MVLAMKIPTSFTSKMVVDYFSGKLFDGILLLNGKFKAPPQCNPRYTVQIGKYNVFFGQVETPRRRTTSRYART